MSKKKSNNDTRVFVYGSLKQGHGNHPLLKNAKRHGFARLATDDLELRDFGAYPGVVRVKEGTAPPLCGEVYTVTESELDSLDVLEGHPNFYKREKIKTPYGKAWVYLLPEGSMDGFPLCETGSWRPSEEEVAYLAKEGADVG